MGKRISIGLAILILALITLWALNYLAVFDLGTSRTNHSDSTIPVNNVTSPTIGTSSMESVPFKVEPVVKNLTVPWSIIFTGPERMLVSERGGDIREVVNGQLKSDPVFTFNDTAHTKSGEIGLMGLVLDPDYSNNKQIYACVGYSAGKGFADRVVQLKDTGSSLEEQKTIIDGIPAGSNHAGCELAFGPDGKLYISTGDATQRTIAQDLNSLGGKILRLNPDGSIPADNPFANSPVYSYGHRNPQGIDWTTNGTMYEAEHGPSGNDGPGGGDEVNLITKGANYGWPLVSHQETKEGTEAPLITYTPAEAPSSLLIYKGEVFPQFKNTLLIAALRGEGILWLHIDPMAPKNVLHSQKLAEVKVGRVRDITEGPDGMIYFTTSNKDGRGRPSVDDDVIYRFVPADM